MSRQSPPAPAGSLRVGEWLVEPSLNRLTRHEVCVRVEPKVMDLLVFFALRPGHVVGRQELVDGVWHGAVVEDGTLTRAVARLRAALGGDRRSGAYLETIPKRGYRLVAPVAADDDATPFPSASPLTVCVARDRELAALAEAAAAACDGAGRVVLVTGDAGAGKTVLVHEVVTRALATQPRIVAVVGACNFYNGAGDPFLPFRQILAQLTGDVDAVWPAFSMGPERALRLRAALPAAVRAIGRRGPDLVGTLLEPRELRRRLEADPLRATLLRDVEPLLDRAATGAAVTAAWRQDLLEQVSRVIEEVSETHPVLVVLEDLHWADPGTLDLLFHLARRISTRHVLVVASYRPEEVALGRGGERHPLERVVNELRRLFGELEVAVGIDGGGRFVDALLDLEPNRLDAGFRAALCRWSGGHALFTVELLRHLRQRGSVARGADGRWEEAAEVDWNALPARVEGVIAERVARLPVELRHLLEVAAVEGEEFTAEVVARAIGLDDAATAGVLSGELERRHQLVRAAGQRAVAGATLTGFRFAHFLVQHYLYKNLGAAERRRSHRGVAEALRALRGDDPTMVVALARHFREAAMPAEAIGFLRLAGVKAAMVSAHREAIAHFDRALELVAMLPEGAERAELELDLQVARLGPLQAASGALSPDTMVATDRVAELAERSSSGAALGRALLVLLVRHGVQGDYVAVERLAARMTALTAARPDDALALSATAATTFFVHLGRFTEVRVAAESVLAAYETGRHSQLSYLLGWDPGVASLGNLAWSQWHLGYADTAARNLRAALELAAQVGHSTSQAYAQLFAGGLAVFSRDAAAAALHAQRIHDLAIEHRLQMWEIVVLQLLGFADVIAGRFADGERRLRELLRQPFVPSRAFALLHLAEAVHRSGRADEALAVVEEGLRRIEGSGERMTEVELRTMHGLVLADLGRADAAEQAVRRALHVALEQQARLPGLSAALALMRLRHAAGERVDREGVLSRALAELPERTGHPDVAAAESLVAGARLPGAV